MSSSRSGQCIPSPPPMRRQCARSSGVPCASRGNQERGTVTVLPSTRSTIRASSLTCMLCAMASLNSVSEILMPSPQKAKPTAPSPFSLSVGSPRGETHGSLPRVPGPAKTLLHTFPAQRARAAVRLRPPNRKEPVRSGPKDGRQRPQCTRSTRGFSTKEKTAKWVLSPV